MEAEAEKLKSMTVETEKKMIVEQHTSPTPTSPVAANPATVTFPTIEERKEADTRSVYVGNVGLLYKFLRWILFSVDNKLKIIKINLKVLRVGVEAFLKFIIL